MSAVDDINFEIQDSSFILEISGSPSLNAPVDILTPAGTHHGVIVEIAAGSLNAPTDVCNTKMQIVEVKRADCFAS